MNTEERLDRIEAILEQNAEQIAANTQAIDRLNAAQDRLTAAQDRMTAAQDHLIAVQATHPERMTQLMDTMNRLANIVISHDQRLDDLENRQ